MSNPFNFPPPPPPPPIQNASYFAQSTAQSRGGFNNIPGRGGVGHRGRGRGRGHSQGGLPGGYAGNHGNALGYSGYPQGNNSGMDGHYNHPNAYGTGNYPLPDYPQVQQPQYPPNVYNSFGQSYSQQPSSQSYPNPPYSSYPPFPSNGQTNASHFNSRPPNQNLPYAPPSHNMPQQPNGVVSPPMMMGPPIHIGSDGRPVGQEMPPYAHLTTQDGNRMPLGNRPSGASRSARYDSPNSFTGRGTKRNRTEAFRKTSDARPSTQVAPAVPSFGNPLPNTLPTKPPVPVENAKKKKKKKRRHNQLGLTPKTEEYVSSEEDQDDQDEEAKLAAAAGGELQQ